jgi:hypothetical protein
VKKALPTPMQARTVSQILVSHARGVSSTSRDHLLSMALPHRLRPAVSKPPEAPEFSRSTLRYHDREIQYLQEESRNKFECEVETSKGHCGPSFVFAPSSFQGGQKSWPSRCWPTSPQACEEKPDPTELAAREISTHLPDLQVL